MLRPGTQLRTGIALLAWATVLSVVGLSLHREQRRVRAELVTRLELVVAMDRVLVAVREAARLGAESREDFRHALEAKGFRCFEHGEGPVGELSYSVVFAGGENGWLKLKPRAEGAWRAETCFPVGGEELVMKALVHPTRRRP